MPAEEVGRIGVLVGTEGAGPEPGVPVEAWRRRYVRRFADAVREHVADADRGAGADVAEASRVQNLREFQIGGVSATVEADRGDAVCLLLNLHHAAAFGNGDGQRFFAVDILARMHSGDTLNRMPMVRRRNADRVDFRIIEQSAVVRIALGRFREFFRHVWKAWA